MLTLAWLPQRQGSAGSKLFYAGPRQVFFLICHPRVAGAHLDTTSSGGVEPSGRGGGRASGW